MELSFAKLHGLGNDFVFIDDRDCALDLTDEQVSYLCLLYTSPSPRD